MKKERLPGFCWVKYQNEWTIGFWNYYGILDWTLLFGVCDSDISIIYDKNLEEIMRPLLFVTLKNSQHERKKKRILLGITSPQSLLCS